MRVVVVAIGCLSFLCPVVSSAHLPSGPDPGPDPAATPATAETSAPVAERPTDEEIRANLRAARMSLGSRNTANVLLIGPPRPDWVEAAGGTAAPTNIAWPLDRGRLLRGYGTGRRGRHRALDIGAPGGTQIRAAERGLVAYADRGVRGYGNLAMIVHPGGWVTFYAHAADLLVRPGQIVARGEVIAHVGHSGRAVGDHLHFELRRDGVKLDPAPYLVDLPPGQRIAAHQPLPASIRTHRVRRGDNLQRISRRTGVPVARLVALNGLRRTSRLRVGQSLLLPAAPTAHRSRAPHGGRRQH
ncbi:MAG: peptidoglycan DD-metalloendopeptidase family protein [Deltaproteobacteria bacterium]|nr:peptidoglycan DD-metalloendopeptidase family protein [Deltaproteobacteria bacterium]